MVPTIPAPLTVHRLLVARFRHGPTHTGRLATTTGGEGAVATVVRHHAGLLRLYFGSLHAPTPRSGPASPNLQGSGLPLWPLHPYRSDILRAPGCSALAMRGHSHRRHRLLDGRTPRGRTAQHEYPGWGRSARHRSRRSGPAPGCMLRSGVVLGIAAESVPMPWDLV